MRMGRVYVCVCVWRITLANNYVQRQAFMLTSGSNIRESVNLILCVHGSHAFLHYVDVFLAYIKK